MSQMRQQTNGLPRVPREAGLEPCAGAAGRGCAPSYRLGFEYLARERLPRNPAMSHSIDLFDLREV
jgi:hypothetical protein